MAFPRPLRFNHMRHATHQGGELRDGRDPDERKQGIAAVVGRGLTRVLSGV